MKERSSKERNLRFLSFASFLPFTAADPDPTGIFSKTEYDLAVIKGDKVVSQPASFNEPRDGETVLSCKHITRKLKTFYVGDKNGLGMFIRSQQAGDFWVRWIVLCRWCDWWRRLFREDPLEAASCKSTWIAEGNGRAADNQDR